MQDGELEPGRRIGRYVVERLLGRGGMAEVYLVRHEQLQSLHALKLLTLSSRSIRARLLQEGRVQASLRHPNAVAVTDVLEVDGAPALLMEYVEGRPMDEWLAEEQPDLDTVLELFRSIVSAVQAAHDQGLVHRDLKPANVLVTSGPQGWLPKVADFGLAKVLSADEEGGQMTRSGITMGTPSFMAPEQIRDAKNVDARADLFSLGCILYQAVCGRPAFEGDDLVSIFSSVTSGAYPPPEEVEPSAPPAVSRAIRGCLQVDPDARIPSCAALLEVLDGGGRGARPSPPPTREDRAWLPAVGAAGGLAVLGTGAAAVLVVAVLCAIPSLLPSGPCGVRDGATAGYAGVGPVFLKSQGSEWTVLRDLEVRADYPREGNDWQTDASLVCVLPAGTVVEVVEAPVRVRSHGWWVPIVGGRFTVPDDVEE